MLLIKEKGILAGIRIAAEIFTVVDNDLSLKFFLRMVLKLIPAISHFSLRKTAVDPEI